MKANRLSDLPAMLIVITVMFSVLAQHGVLAQAVPWSAPIDLSASQWSSVRPVVSCDGAGNVHVFWGEATGLLMENEDIKVIYYARYDGAAWSIPADIFAAIEPGYVWPLTAAVDRSGKLHLIWAGSSSGQAVLYHSWAWAAEPITARSWTTTQLDAGWTSFSYADLVLDASGSFHLVYVSGTDTIYYLASSDGGQNWSVASEVVSAAPGAPVFEPMLRIDGKGTRHVVWTEHNDQGYNVAVHYARSEDGRVWDGRLVADGGCGWIGIGIRGDQEVHLVWSRGIGSVDGRYHEWSEDGGLTWSSPAVIWPNVSGYTGFPQMITDSDGTLHLVLSGAAHWLTGRYGVSCILCGEWNSQTRAWGELAVVAGVAEPGTHEHPRIVVTGGNLLHAVWVVWGEPTRIFYAQTQLSSKAISLTPLPAPPSISGTPTPWFPAGSSPTPNGSGQTALPFDSEPMSSTPAMQWPVLLGIVPALVLVGGAILIRALRRR